MYELVVSQENMALLSLLVGVLMGATYDVFRGLRRVFPHRNLVLYFEDVLYWLFWTGVIVYIVQTKGSGIIRLYIFLAILIGLIVYLMTISRLYIFVLLKIIYFTKKLAKKTKNMLKCVVKKVRIKIIVKKFRKFNGDSR